jgi:tetratricopeptide (TPR) repeat protein
MSDLIAAVRTSLNQLRDAGAAQARGAERLAALPVAEWPEAIKADETLRVPAVLEFVLDRAKQELDSYPNCALALTTTVIDILPNDPALLVLRGRALNTHAQAVRETGDVVMASTFITTALVLLASDPAGRDELQRARIFAAHVMHDQGNRTLAFQLLHEAGREAVALGNARVALYANMTHAGLLLADEDPPRDKIEHARDLYLAMLPVADALHDERERARLLSDLGGCARRLGDHEQALAYYTQATPLYVKLGMVTEAEKITWGMAPIIAASGRVGQAVTALRGARDAFLKNGALLEAALVSLELLSLLLRTVKGHELVPPLAAELVQVFTAAGMPAPALRAWTQLKTAAQRNKLDQQKLRRVRAVQQTYLRAA